MTPQNAFERDKPGTNARSDAQAAIETLRQRGGIFVEAVRSTRMAMALTDPTLPGNPIVFANQSFLDLSGYSMEEVLGQQPYFMNGPGTDSKDAARFRQILEEDRDGVIESVQYAKDGHRFVATILLSAFKDGDGKTIHHFLSWSDVTRRVDAEEEADELRRAKAALGASEERQGFLLKLSDALRPLADAAEIQATTTRLTGSHLSADRSMYAEVSGEPGTETGIVRGQYVRPASPGHSSPAPFPEHFTYETFGAEAMARRYSGKGLAVADIETAPGFEAAERAAWASAGVRAAIVVPLVKDGRLVAEFGIHSATPRAWTDSEASLVQEVAERTWAAAERVRAEEALREGEARLQLILQSMSEAVYVGGADGISLANPAALDQLGYQSLDELNRDIGTLANEIQTRDYRTGEAIPAEDQPFSRALAGEPTVREVIVRHLKSGEERVLRSAASPVIEHRQVIAAVAVNTDITDLKRKESALRESEERFRRIVESATDYAILVTDPDDIIVDWMPGAAAVFGWSSEEAIGRPAGITFTPEDRAQGEPEKEIETSAREGLALDVRWHRRKDGSLVFIEGSVTPLFTEDGSIRGFLKIGQDVTERRNAQELLEASERRMRTLVTGIPQIVFRSEGDGSRTWGSPQWTDYTGLSFEESLGFGWLERVHPEDRQATRAAWDRAEERGEYYCEHRICHAASGEYQWHQTRAAPSRDEEGRIVEWLGTSTEVEELRSLHRRQQLLVAELQHRVRNIMAMIRSVARRTAETSDSAEDYAQHLEGRIGAMARTQALLTREVGRGVDLQNLILDELEAQAAAGERFIVRGPDVALSPKAAEVLTLAVHELATNSTKYGALSQAGGRIEIGWTVERNGSKPEWLDLRWTEFGVRLNGDGRREGFGTELITRRVPYELKGEGEIEFRETGVAAMVRFPLREGSSVLQTDAAVAGAR